MEIVPDWSGLLPDLLAQVSLCLPLMEDFVAFRGVCTTWRAAAAKDMFKSKVPLLMLAEMDGSDEREFYSLSKRKICARIPFPGAKGKKCIDAGFGWILTLSVTIVNSTNGETNAFFTTDGETNAFNGANDGVTNGETDGESDGESNGETDGESDDETDGESDDEIDVPNIYSILFGNIQGKIDGEVHLVKPFDSSAIIQLPNIETFPKYHENSTWPEHIFIQRVLLSADPSETSDFVLLVIVNHSMGFWRNGDNHWTSINLGVPIHYGNVAHCQGKVYVLNADGNIHVLDPSGSDLTRADVMLTLDDPTQKYIMEATPYLVESTDGELLLILRNNASVDCYFEKGTTEFKVKRVDLVKRMCEDIKGVGGDAIFLGDNHTIAVAAADFPGVLKSNCIYFTDDNLGAYWGYHFYDKSRCMGGGKDMGIYNVEDKNIERFDVESFSLVSPPQWIFPLF